MDSIPQELLTGLIIFFLILFSGFFSGSETALTALSKAKIHKLTQKGHKKARFVSDLRKDKDFLISSILVGNNLVNILASALATKLFIDIFGNNGVAIATIIMTILVVIFAEVLPKTIAIYNAEEFSLIVAKPLKIITKILLPITKSAQFFVKIFTNIIKKTQSEKKDDLITAIEELRGTIELHHKEGGVLKQDKDMLDSILDLAETEVSMIMTHRKKIFAIDASEKSEKIIQDLARSPHTRVPIWQNSKDNIIGILHAKDVLKTIIHSTKELKEIDFTKLATEPWFIPENTSLRDQLFAFKQMRNHFAIVVDEYGSVLGIVTLEDILEEIVGEIKDEHDKGTTEIYKKLANNSYLIDGSIAIRDINRDLDWSLPEEASSIAGLLINQCEKIPDRDENFEFFGFSFTVTEKHKNQITKLTITKLPTTKIRA